VVLINKTDKPDKEKQEEIAKRISIGVNETLMFIPAKNKTGLDDLRNKLGSVVMKDKISSDDVILTNIRHYEAMIRVSESLGRVLSGIENNIPDDLIAIDIRQAIHYLGEITGTITSDEILGNIFKNFCIGK